jgi:hypothetical protein
MALISRAVKFRFRIAMGLWTMSSLTKLSAAVSLLNPGAQASGTMP